MLFLDLVIPELSTLCLRHFQYRSQHVLDHLRRDLNALAIVLVIHALRGRDVPFRNYPGTSKFGDLENCSAGDIGRFNHLANGGCQRIGSEGKLVRDSVPNTGAWGAFRPERRLYNPVPNLFSET